MCRSFRNKKSLKTTTAAAASMGAKLHPSHSNNTNSTTVDDESVDHRGQLLLTPDSSASDPAAAAAASSNNNNSRSDANAADSDADVDDDSKFRQARYIPPKHVQHVQHELQQQDTKQERAHVAQQPHRRASHTSIVFSKKPLMPSCTKRKNNTTTSNSNSNSNNNCSADNAKDVSATMTPLSSAARIRSRFLSKVGITPPAPAPTPASTRVQAEARARAQAAKSSRIRPRPVPLGNCMQPKAAKRHECTTAMPSSVPSGELRRRFSDASNDDTASTCSLSSVSSSSILLLRCSAAAPSPLPSPENKNNKTTTATTAIIRIKTKKNVTFSPTSTCRPIPSRHSYSRRVRRALWNTSDQMRTSVERNTIEYLSEGWTKDGVLEEEDMYADPTTGKYVHPVHVRLWYERQKEVEARAKERREREALAAAVRVASRQGQVRNPARGLVFASSVATPTSPSKDNFVAKSRAAARNWSQFA
eukprot:CAMPEP_0113560968 /NCGR_PEP_ID=MMETSP0015_2-20120614/19726_1 /TAXON_ID=2838 /ORGANISM="Odontella" /LENGTH=475 /DNA_ID=CAMNT_0000462733 /DNA_START=306 /DNA_END=1733 /DNA_ORIENTATION=+ /assembly_acc=CAM_ASM_000160